MSTTSPSSSSSRSSRSRSTTGTTSPTTVITSPTTDSGIPASSSSIFSTETNPFPPPTQSPRNRDPDNSLQNSAQLYLYTFLATLILLLGVSAAIVLRSLLLRRRNRRLIEEAIRNGTWVPPADGEGGRRRKVGERPKFYEVYLGVPTELAEQFVLGAAQPSSQPLNIPAVKEKEKAAEQRGSFTYDWDLIQPFSVSSSNPASSAVSSVTPTPATPATRHSMVSRLGGALARLRPTTRSPPSAAGISPPSPSTDIPLKQVLEPSPSEDEKLRGPLSISVLIAMPSQTPLSTVLTQARDSGEDEGELPHLVVGVAQDVPVESGQGIVQGAIRSQASGNTSNTKLDGTGESNSTGPVS